MHVDRHLFLFFLFLFFSLSLSLFEKYEKLFRLDKFCPRLGIAIYFVFIPFTMRLNDASTCISFSLCLSSRTNAMCVYSVYTRIARNERNLYSGQFLERGKMNRCRAFEYYRERERERGGGRVARPILVVIVPTERAREADTSDRVSTIRDHLSTIETPLRSRGACCVAVKCTACTLRPGILFVNARIR